MDDRWHRATIRVRYSETDAMGIAYNAHYLTWFEVGRTELLRASGLTYRESEHAGYFLPLLEAGVKYLKPATYDDVIVVRSCIGVQPGLRVRIEYEVDCEGRIIATGFTEHVFTGPNIKPKKPSRRLRELMERLWTESPRNRGNIA